MLVSEEGHRHGAGQASILLIDAVEWSDAYPTVHPLRNVGEWFVRFLRDVPGATVEVVRARDEAQCVKVAEASRLCAVRVRDEARRANLEGLCGVILSGSPRDAWAPDPVNDRLAELILRCRDRSVPFLGVCYGHQLIAHVLGGKVARHPDGLEVGTTGIELTEAGRRSPLFDRLPAQFEVIESHQDAVLTLPPGAELLAQGGHTPIQAFQVGPLMMGVQFHPEMDPQILQFVWDPRRKLWREKVTFDLDEKLASTRPAPAGPQVLKNFAKFCLKGL